MFGSHTEIEMTSFIAICRKYTHIYLHNCKLILKNFFNKFPKVFFKLPVKITYNKKVTTQIISFFNIIVKSILK